jgi:hypothetical protein
MKKTLLAIAALAVAVGMQAQGLVDFVTIKSNPKVDAKVTDAITGLAVGSEFSAQLWWGTSEATLTPAIDNTTGQPIVKQILATPAAAKGYVNAGTQRIKDMVPGVEVLLQMVAWESSFGTDYGTAMNALGRVGKSIPITITPGGNPPGGGLPITSPLPVGLLGFTVAAIPEPSILGLGLIGAAALMLRRRN